MRKVVAIAAAPGLIAGICVFIASFLGLTMDKLGAKAILLHIDRDFRAFYSFGYR